MHLLKSYCKEIFVICILTIGLSLLFAFIPEPMSRIEAFSPRALIIAIFALLIPLFTSLMGSYLISKKSANISDYVKIPVIGVLIATWIMMLYSIVKILAMSPDDWISEYNKIKDIMPVSMTLEEFKNITVNGIVTGLFVVSAINAGLATIGGLIGRYILSKTQK